MSNSIKPTAAIGASTGFSMKLFKHMVESTEKTSGKAPDVCVVGTDAMAEDVRAAIEELGYSMAVVADDELSPKRVWVTSLNALGELPLGGRN